MLWAFLAYLLFAGGHGFAVDLFAKDTQTTVRQVVVDPARTATAVETLKQGRKELKAAVKQLSKNAKAFNKADKDHAAGLDELTPLVQQSLELRRATQAASLDRIFELREILSEEEWNRLMATVQ
jgi:hypothetical protein